MPLLFVVFLAKQYTINPGKEKARHKQGFALSSPYHLQPKLLALATSRPVVARHLGINTQLPGAVGRPAGGQLGVDHIGPRAECLGRHAVGRLALFHPGDQRSQHVERVGGADAGAVVHAGHQEQARKRTGR